MILNSWKEIASYLRCSVRTAQRLEQSGMPVRRPAGHSRSAVIAMSDEIDVWLGESRNSADSLTTRVESHSGHGKNIRAELATLRQRMADCRTRSLELRTRALQIRGRKRFNAPLSDASL